MTVTSPTTKATIKSDANDTEGVSDNEYRMTRHELKLLNAGSSNTMKSSKTDISSDIHIEEKPTTIVHNDKDDIDLDAELGLPPSSNSSFESFSNDTFAVDGNLDMPTYSSREEVDAEADYILLKDLFG